MEPRASVIEKRLKNIKRIIAVASGKGGVGKSMVASTLALHLSQHGYRVGLLDLDLYGPSSHIILGVNNKFPTEEKGIIPPTIHGISFMSIVFFTEEKPSPFRGIDISNIILELLTITQWGSLDFLIIDMPPGIGDETLDVIRYIKSSEFLIVTTPSKVAMGAVSKLLIMLIELKKPILGVIIEGNVPFIVISGLLTTHILKRLSPDLRKTIITIVASGIFCIIAGFILRRWFIISKIMATPSWGLICTGISMVLFALLYWIIDIKKITKWTLLLKPAGENSLTTYLVPDILYYLIWSTGIPILIYKQSGFPLVVIAGSVIWALLMVGLTALLVRFNIKLKL